MTNRYIVNPLTHCTELLDDNYRKETIYKLYLILLFRKTVRHNMEVFIITLGRIVILLF